MSFRRGFLPRPVRRAMHPVRSTAGSIKRRATPKPIRTIQYASHPVGTTPNWLDVSGGHRRVRSKRGYLPNSDLRTDMNWALSPGPSGVVQRHATPWLQVWLQKFTLY
jgi:hypothetical protein